MDILQYAKLSSRLFNSRSREFTVGKTLFKSSHLTFDMEAQTQSNWCWAATSKSVSQYYWHRSSWTQCSIANAELGHSDCCSSPVPAPCNVPWFLDSALSRTRNFVSISGPCTFEQLRAQIDSGRPVGARIGWSGGGGHFMVIYGYTYGLGFEWIDIDDPIYGKSHMSLDDFTNRYQGNGTWTHTYFTKSYFPMPIIPILIDDRIIQIIWDPREILNRKLAAAIEPNTVTKADEADSAIGLARRVYTLELGAILREEKPQLHPAFLRVFESVNGTPSAFYDVVEGEQPRLINRSEAKPTISQMMKGTEAAIGSLKDEANPAELRQLRFPALNFEAIWLHFPENGEDKLIQTSTFGPLKLFEPVDFSEGMNLLREAARPLASMEDKMGS